METSPTFASPARCEVAPLFGPTRTTLRVEKAESAARFAAATLWGRVPVKGHLGEVTGALECDGARGQGQLMIATSELSSGNRIRDHHLRSGDFFDVARHPEVSFDVSEIVVDGRAVRLQGELLIRGRRHAFACPATGIRLSQDRIALEAGATLDLDELGMSRGLLHMLRASVTADVRVVLQRVVS